MIVFIICFIRLPQVSLSVCLFLLIEYQNTLFCVKAVCVCLCVICYVKWRSEPSSLGWQFALLSFFFERLYWFFFSFSFLTECLDCEDPESVFLCLLWWTVFGNDLFVFFIWQSGDTLTNMNVIFSEKTQSPSHGDIRKYKFSHHPLTVCIGSNRHGNN